MSEYRYCFRKEYMVDSMKISEFALMIFFGRSESWQTLELSRFKISGLILVL